MISERVPASSAVRLRLGIYCLVVLLGFLAALIALLPPQAIGLAAGWRWALLVAAAGGLGASIHTATSFSHHAGVGTLGSEWSWWFIMRPALGAGLGIVFILVVAGLGVSDALQSIPPDDAMRMMAAYIALAGLAGMFSRQAIDWLRGIFDRLFRAPDRNEEADKARRLTEARTREPQEPKPVPPPSGDAPREDAYGPLWRGFIAIYVGGMLVLLASTIALTWVVLGWLAEPPLPSTGECLVSLLVTIAAALGATIHVFTSVADFAGRNKLRRQWLWWYILRPFIAAALGLLMYFAVRAVWIVKLEEPAQLYGILVVALLAGVFSKQTIRWLSELYDAIFHKVENLEQENEEPPQPRA